MSQKKTSTTVGLLDAAQQVPNNSKFSSSISKAYNHSRLNDEAVAKRAMPTVSMNSSLNRHLDKLQTVTCFISAVC